MPAAWAQLPTSRSPNDSLYRRARRWVSEGNGPAGRALVDSLIKGESEGSRGYGDALYWRGALAETAADAERDYRRVIVEYPLSSYADDALLAIAELEQARGDREGALQHLQRFVKEHPASAARGTAAFAAARLAFEQRDSRTGCAMLADARASVPDTNVEVRNQIDYLNSRCPIMVAGSAATNTPTPPVMTIPVRDASPAPATSKEVTKVRTNTPSPRMPDTKPPPVRESRPAMVETPPNRAAIQPMHPVPIPTAAVQSGATQGMYTIQLAAYNTRIDAEQLVSKLGATGVKARVSGTSRPFRVRLNFFPTRQAAQEQVAALKQRGIIGFVTTEEPLPEGPTP